MTDVVKDLPESPAHKTRITDPQPRCIDCAILARRFDDHLLDFREYKHEETKKWDVFLDEQRSNTASINTLVQSTNGLVEAWEAGSGAIKVINWGGRLVKWAGGMGLALAAALTWFTHK